ncbi:MAG: PDZ domain-containing protein, partial [Planctomycetota bacterium]
EGQPLGIDKTDKSTWLVQTDNSPTVVVQYELFADSINDRTRYADDNHAYLSGSSVFLYTDERRHEPRRVVVDAPPHWRTATGLDPDPTVPGAWVARDYDVLVDSPFEIGEHQLIEFDIRGVPHEYVLWGRYDGLDFDRLVADTIAITEHQADIFGDMPYGRYVFMVHSAPGFGGGTEHLNSTIMQTRPTTWRDDDAYNRFLGLVSHEMFHTWNVKRLRPAGLTPYEYQRENYTDLLWVAEGTTSYYDDLTLARTGIITLDDYLDGLARTIGSVNRRPGRDLQSLRGSSFDAWVKFNRPTDDSGNSTVNFYSQGALVSLLLDLEIRRLTQDQRSLDDVLRDLYERHPLGAGGFTTADLLAGLQRVSGEDLAWFVDTYVGRPVRLDDALTEAFARVGLLLERDEPDDDQPAYLGILTRDEDGFAGVRGLLAESPAYDAGIIAGDVIIAINNVRATPGEIDAVLTRCAGGETITLSVMRRDELRTFDIAVDAPRSDTWTLEQAEAPTPSHQAAFEAWLHVPWDAGNSSDAQE